MSDQSSLKKAIYAVLPESLATDLKDNIDAVIQSTFEQMNLVSRQEFDVQRKVLAKTRAKLEALEKSLDELEK